MDGFHHLSLRKRIFKNLEPFPHPNALKRSLDRVMLFIALAGPLATIPQVYQVYVSQDAKGLSLLTWVIWTLLSALWVLYGYLHKELPILAANVVYVILQAMVVLAIVTYG